MMKSQAKTIPVLERFGSRLLIPTVHSPSPAACRTEQLGNISAVGGGGRGGEGASICGVLREVPFRLRPTSKPQSSQRISQVKKHESICVLPRVALFVNRFPDSFHHVRDRSPLHHHHQGPQQPKDAIQNFVPPAPV